MQSLRLVHLRAIDHRGGYPDEEHSNSVASTVSFSDDFLSSTLPTGPNSSAITAIDTRQS